MNRGDDDVADFFGALSDDAPIVDVSLPVSTRAPEPDPRNETPRPGGGRGWIGFVHGRRRASGDAMSKARVVLAVDVGGSHVKVLTSGETASRRAVSGPRLTASEMVKLVLGASKGWHWDVVTIGIPAPIHGGRVASEPVNLGKGWVGFDFESAFGTPTKVMNDAAMQALGSYIGGTMLFLGLGTGLGTSLIVDGIVERMEMGHLPFKKGSYEDYVGERGRLKRGNKRWREHVTDAVEQLTAALEPDSVVIGGGNARKLRTLPANTRLGDNANAFAGGFRAWTDSATSPHRRASQGC
jgi:polyphosphate glucokinase